MSDPRTVLRETLAHQLLVTRQARDALWEDYWQRRRVVVVPDKTGTDERDVVRIEGDVFDGLEHTNVFSGWAPVVRDCIARLKAVREKEAVNKNLSTLLAVVVKVQRDLEALLNGG